MARRNIYEMNYARLAELLGEPPEEVEPEKAYRLCSDGFMDFIVEKLAPGPTQGAILLSLAHYFEQHGDLCQDPEMVVRIFPPGEDSFQDFAPSTDSRHGRLEALMFQQAIPPVFRAAYPEPGRFDPEIKRELNDFLETWLRNLKRQGHRLVGSEPEFEV